MHGYENNLCVMEVEALSSYCKQADKTTSHLKHRICYTYVTGFAKTLHLRYAHNDKAQFSLPIDSFIHKLTNHH